MTRWHWADFRFADPWFLGLLLLLPLAYFWIQKKQRTLQSGLVFPPSRVLMRLPLAPARRALHILLLLRLMGLACLIAALARPQLGAAEEDLLTEGVDIVVALDCSGSMAAEDFQPKNRIGVAKQQVQDFVLGRHNDRIGLVVFAARSFTKCPLTVDYDVLLKQVEDVRLGTIQDGTAIGNGLATALNRLRSSKAKSRVIILLTDGVNNTGEIDPLTAAEIAKSLGVKIYTIGVGREGIVPYPVDDPVFGRRTIDVEVKIDEELLKKIARATGGEYYRAVDRDSLERIFKTIDSLEKSKIQVKSYTHYQELFAWLLWPGLAFVLGGSILEQTRWRKLP
jgi:Ca-activated chloride channel family protein